MNQVLKWFRTLRQSVSGSGSSVGPDFCDQSAPYGDETATEQSTDSPDSSRYARGESCVGMVRSNNEDSFLCESGRGLYVVADGMGGHAAGEIASQTVITTVSQFLSGEAVIDALHRGPDSVAALLNGAILKANEEVLVRASENWNWHGMGSTVVIGILSGNNLYVANVGDSRAYLIRDRAPAVLTRDHSVAAALIEEGKLSPDEARNHPLRSQLTSVVGSDEPPQVSQNTIVLHSGDRVAFCSDGLWDMLSDEAIAGIISDKEDAADAARSLTNAANEAGGHDNVTALVVFVSLDPEQSAIASETQQ